MDWHGTLQARETSHMLLINNGTGTFADATPPRERSPSFLMVIDPALNSVLTVSGVFFRLSARKSPHCINQLLCFHVTLSGMLMQMTLGRKLHLHHDGGTMSNFMLLVSLCLYYHSHVIVLVFRIIQ